MKEFDVVVVMFFSLSLFPLAAMCKLSCSALNCFCFKLDFPEMLKQHCDSHLGIAWLKIPYKLLYFFFSAFLDTLALILLNIELRERSSEEYGIDRWVEIRSVSFR